jgi:hypothetical protein
MLVTLNAEGDLCRPTYRIETVEDAEICIKW